MPGKSKLNLSVDEKVKKAAQEKVGEGKLSGLVENFLRFVAKPELWCFKCGKNFNATQTQDCPKCGFLRCPKCKACRCGMTEETAIAVFNMRKVYEHLVGGRVS